MISKKIFQKKIWDFYHKEGRILPWRKTRDPYKILVSEIMLQQTQVPRVVEKYKSFLKKFPTPLALHNATTAQVLAEWQGLGYNRRGLALKRLTDEVVKNHKGKIPKEISELESLPGIGPYTARAVSVFAYNTPQVFIETNIRTVFIFFFFKEQEIIHDKDIFPLIEQMLDSENPREWYYALMDYGSMLKKEYGNLNKKSKHYVKQSKFKGSGREVRSAILKYVLAKQNQTVSAIHKNLPFDNPVLDDKIKELVSEGFLTQTGNQVMLISTQSS